MTDEAVQAIGQTHITFSGTEHAQDFGFDAINAIAAELGVTIKWNDDHTMFEVSAKNSAITRFDQEMNENWIYSDYDDELDEFHSHKEYTL